MEIHPVEVLDENTGKFIEFEYDVDDPVLHPLNLHDHVFRPLLQKVLVGNRTLSVPFAKNDPRLIVYEMRRQKTAGLPPLAGAVDIGEDDEKSDDGMSVVGEQEEDCLPEESECSNSSDFMLAELCKRIQDNAPLEKSFSVWFQSQHVQRQRRFYKRVHSLVVNSNGNMTEFNRLLTLLTGSHTAALPLGSSEQALAAMFYLTVS